jgi:signal transduction histidine kinase
VAERRFVRRLVPGSVRARTTLASLLVVGVSVFAGSFLFLGELRKGLVHTVDQSAQLHAERVTRLIEAGTLPRQLDLPVDADEDDIVIQVVDGEGRVIAASANGWISALSDLRPGPPDKQMTETVTNLPLDPSSQFRIFARAALSSSDLLTVLVGTELKRGDQAVRTVGDILRKGALALLVLVGALTWVLVGRALGPVDSIRRQVEEISGAALDRRVPERGGHDEISRLARTMNAMLDRLQSSVERQRRFASDASHELRSPLASSRAHLEVAVAHPDAVDWPATAAELLEENHRMERLVADLLFLARADGSTQAPRVGPVDVDDLVLTEVGRLRSRGRVAVDISRVSAARVKGNAELLARVVRNLLENAERHAHSAARVELYRHNGEVELVVADDGLGVPAPDRERIFDRFNRLDAARARRDGGAGLGLAIAREIVTAHGGRIWADEPGPATNGGGPGARFVVRLPARY